MRKSRQATHSPPMKPIADSVTPTDTTLDCSFTSTDEQGESLTVSLVRPNDDEEGVETPLNGAIFWAVKRNVLKPMTPSEAAAKPATVTPLQDPDDLCEQGTPSNKMKVVPMTPPMDPDEWGSIEMILNQDADQKSQADTKDKQDEEEITKVKERDEEEGFEMNLSDFEKETRMILLDLQGAEVATTTKKVRFEINPQDEISMEAKAASRYRRKQIVKFLRTKSKKSKTTVGCPPLVQMALETKKERVCPKTGRERVDHQTSKFTGVVIELYDCFLKAVTESYLLCQSTGAFLEEAVMDLADTEFLRELLDDNTVDLFGDIDEGSKGLEKEIFDDNDLSLAESFSFEVLVPYDEARGSKPVFVKVEETGPRTGYV